MKDELGLDVELVEKGRGIYDIEVDGEMLYSKHEAGRFPDEDREVIAPLKARRNPG